MTVQRFVKIKSPLCNAAVEFLQSHTGELVLGTSDRALFAMLEKDGRAVPTCSPKLWDGPRFITLPEIQAITALSGPSIYRLAAEGKFPAPTKIGPHASRWLESEVVAWMKEQLADRETSRLAPSYARRTFAESVARAGPVKRAGRSAKARASSAAKAPAPKALAAARAAKRKRAAEAPAPKPATIAVPEGA